MIKEELEILKVDFKDWLTHPLTHAFLKILDGEKKEFLEEANNSAFRNYHKKELQEHTTLCYGKADGIATVMDLIDNCKQSEAIIDSLFNKYIGDDEKK